MVLKWDCLDFFQSLIPTSLTFSSVQSLSCVQLFATPWTTARQASLSITNSRSLLKLISMESVMLSNHVILGRPLLLPPSIFPSIRVFSNESVLHIRWLKYWSFSFSIIPSNEFSGLIFFSMDWLDHATYITEFRAGEPCDQVRSVFAIIAFSLVITLQAGSES